MEVFGIVRLVKDVELKQTNSGITVCNFSVAAERDYHAKGEKPDVDFIDCQAWRNTAEFIAKWFHKGDPVFLRGELQTEKWTTDDGQNRTKTYISVEKARFIPSRKQDNAQGEQAVAAPSEPVPNVPAGTVSEDELPF